MIFFTEAAKAKVHEFINSTRKEGMTLRIVVASRNEKGFTYKFELEEYANERVNDVYVREGGFATRIDPESAKWLKGATVDWSVQGDRAGFVINNPNQPIPDGTPETLKSEIIEALKTVYDPEIPVNIYDLGLIYNIDIHPDRNVTVKMTLTAPNCPAAEQLPVDVKNKVKSIPGVNDASVDLTWDPPWNKEMMSEAARLQLNM